MKPEISDVLGDFLLGVELFAAIRKFLASGAAHGERNHDAYFDLPVSIEHTHTHAHPPTHTDTHTQGLTNRKACGHQSETHKHISHIAIRTRSCIGARVLVRARSDWYACPLPCARTLARPPAHKRTRSHSGARFTPRPSLRLTWRSLGFEFFGRSSGSKSGG